MTTEGLELFLDARRMRTEARSAATELNKIKQSAAGVDRSLDGASRKMEQTAKKTNSLQTAVAQLGVAFIGLNTARDAIQVMAGFEKTMGVVAGVTQASASELERLEQTARELGATTRFSAQEAGEGLLFLARAGFSVDEAIESLPATLNLATAGVIELGSAADIASNVLKQFGLEAEDTESVVDTLVNTANSANTDVTQLAEALKFVGPVAASVGFSVEETAAAIGALSDAGVQASSAGTGLRAVLSKLVDTSSINEGALEELEGRLSAVGLALEDIDPRGRSLADVFENLAKANLDTELAFRVFNDRSAVSALILGQSVEQMRELTAANLESGGAAKRNASILENTLEGQFKSLRSAAEELFLVIGDAGVLGALKDLVQFTTQVARALGGVSEEFGEISPAAKVVAEAVKALGIGLAALTAIKIGSFFSGALASFKLFSAALLTNPVGILVTSLTAGIALLIKWRDETVDIGNETFRVGDLLVATWEAFQKRFLAVMKVVQFSFSAVVTGFTTLFTDVGNFILKIWNDIGNALGIDWRAAWETVLEVTKLFVNSTVGVLKTVFDFFGIIGARINRVVAAFEGFDLFNEESRAELADAFGAALDVSGFIEELGKTASDNFKKDFVGEFIDTAKTGAKVVGSQLEDVFKAAGAGISFEEFISPEAFTRDILTRAQELARERQIQLFGGTELDPRVLEQASKVNKEREQSLSIAEEQLREAVRLRKETERQLKQDRERAEFLETQNVEIKEQIKNLREQANATAQSAQLDIAAQITDAQAKLTNLRQIDVDAQERLNQAKAREEEIFQQQLAIAREQAKISNQRALDQEVDLERVKELNKEQERLQQISVELISQNQKDRNASRDARRDLAAIQKEVTDLEKQQVELLKNGSEQSRELVNQAGLLENQLLANNVELSKFTFDTQVEQVKTLVDQIGTLSAEIEKLNQVVSIKDILDTGQFTNAEGVTPGFTRDTQEVIDNALEGLQIGIDSLGPIIGRGLDLDSRLSVKRFSIREAFDQNEALAERAAVLHRLAQEEKLATDIANGFSSSLDRQFRTSLMSNTEIEKGRLLQEAYNAMVKEGLQDTQAFTTGLEQVAQKFDDLERAKEIKAIFDQVGQSFGSAFTSFVTGAQSAEDALESFLRRTSEQLLQQGIASLIGGLGQSLFAPSPGAGFGAENAGAGLFAGFVGAQGGVFGRGGLTAFAQGGVVNGPTIFPFQNGIGLMGEAGPEAILPLTRTAGGDLGVRTDGGSGQNITVIMNITTPNADSFRKSSRQITQDAKKNFGQSGRR